MRALALAAALLLAGPGGAPGAAHSAPAPDERPEISSTEVATGRDGDAALPTPAAGAGAGAGEGAEEVDGELDAAPFVIVVEHGDGRRCGGSLVSLRTAVTSAACVRPRGAEPPELWALAAAAAGGAGGAGAGAVPAADGMRRVTRVALAAPPAPQEGAEGDWRGAELDLAVLELEAPFGGGAEARPIFMASSAPECEAPGEGRERAAGDECHVVRAGGPRRGPLRMVGVVPVGGARCAAAARHWAAVRDRAFCLVGAPLCESDRGAGVVCGGKLCGVLSRSVGGEGAAGPEERCGATHAAQSLARWRRFLHCAHTLRSCGRGDCADVCVEQRLLDDSHSEETSEERAASEAPAGRVAAPEVGAERPPPPPPLTAATLARPRPAAPEAPSPTPTPPRPPARTPPPGPEAAPPPALTSRGAPEFEPNRADFKAGEYGDNAAEYAGEEGGGAGGEQARRPPAPATPAPPPRDPASERRVAAPAPARPAAVSGAAQTCLFHYFIQIVNCYVIIFL